ncbi:MAG TPA: hypothetical protein VN694_07225 [Caulobacteraceae bacterium]|nr:hypothetical protein [Caulobacteraceae bacterium]
MIDIKQTLKKTVLGAAAVATLGAAGLTATTASAQRYDRYGHDHSNNAGAAIGAGILGFALGASLARPAYGPPPGYYAGPSYYTYDEDEGCRYAWRWSEYWGRYVRVERCY